MVDEIDETYVRELVLAATNDQKMYRLAQQSIATLQRRINNNSFDKSKAPLIFKNAYLDQSRAYYEQQTGFTQRMSFAEKELFCKLVYGHYEEEIFSPFQNTTIKEQSKL